MNFLDYLNLIRRRLPLVGAVVGIVSLISLGLSMREQPTYEASLRLRTRQIAPMSSANAFLETQDVQFDPSTEAQLVASEKVGAIVVDKLNLAMKPSDLFKIANVFPLQGTRILAITVKSASPQFAMDIANGLADAYLEVRRAEAAAVFDHAIERASKGLAEGQQRLQEASQRFAAAAPGSPASAEAEAERAIALADVVAGRTLLRALADRSALNDGFGEVISPATEANLVKAGNNPTRSFTFGAMLGIPLSLAIILLLDSLSETIRNAADAESMTGADVLGMIPFDETIPAYGDAFRNGGRRGRLPRIRGGRPLPSGALAVDADPFSLVSEAYRTASLNIAKAADESDCSTILMTSALAGEGKTTTLANLAGATAERERDVLLVDADLRKPSAHFLVSADAEPGLAEFVGAKIPIRQALQAVRPHLTFVGSGAPVERPDQILTRVNLRQVLAKLAARGARNANRNGNGNGNGNEKAGMTVFIDSAPILQAAETLALAQAVDGIVLIVRAGVTRRSAVVRAVEQVHRAGGQLLGVVLVGVSNEMHLGISGGSSRDRGRPLSLVRTGEHAEALAN